MADFLISGLDKKFAPLLDSPLFSYTITKVLTIFALFTTSPFTINLVDNSEEFTLRLNIIHPAAQIQIKPVLKEGNFMNDFEISFSRLASNTNIATATATFFDSLPQDFWQKQSLDNLIDINDGSYKNPEIAKIALEEISRREAPYQQWVKYDSVQHIFNDQLTELLFVKRVDTAQTLQDHYETKSSHGLKKRDPIKDELSLTKMVEMAISIDDWKKVFIFSSKNDGYKALSLEKMTQLSQTIEDKITINWLNPNQENLDSIINEIKSNCKDQLKLWKEINNSLGVSPQLKEYSLQQIIELSK